MTRHMTISSQIAKHLRDVHFGGNWTCVNLKNVLADVTWQQAMTKVDDCNTIATLVYHMYYYVGVGMKVLQGGPLEGKDELSFIHPPVQSREEWEALQSRIWEDVERYAALIEQLPDSKLSEDFVDAKYGSYYRNLAGFVEHTHYHLGQIVIIKKAIAQREIESVESGRRAEA